MSCLYLCGVSDTNKSVDRAHTLQVDEKNAYIHKYVHCIYLGQSICPMFSPFFSPQGSYALVSYFSSRSRVMSRSCEGTLLSWTVRLTESRLSTCDGSRTAWAWWRMRGCTCSPMAHCIYQRWRAEEETNQMKGSISASLRTNMVQSWARKPVLQSQVSVLQEMYQLRCFVTVCFHWHAVVAGRKSVSNSAFKQFLHKSCLVL